MGQFLAVGLATKIGVKKTEADKAQLGMEQLQERMKQELHYVSAIYEGSEENDSYYFTLKDHIFHAQLIPFLKEIYPLLYDRPVYYRSVLKELEVLPPSEWVRWAAKKPEEAFQLDQRGKCDYLDTGNSKIRVYYNCILLSMEGKIMMEVFGRQFKFLKYTMMQAFRQFSISGALRIYITG